MTAVHVDRQGLVWFGIRDRGLFRVDPATTNVQRIISSHSWDAHSIHAIVEDSLGHIWLRLEGSVISLDPSTHQWIRYSPESGLVGSRPETIVADASGHVMVITDEGLNLFDAVAGTWSPLPDRRLPLGADVVWSAAVDPTNALWLSTERGLIRGDMSLKAWTTVRPFSEPFPTRSDAIAVDPQGLLWFLGLGRMLRKDLRTESWGFEMYSKQSPSCVGKQALVDHQGDLWCDTRSGVARFHVATKTWIPTSLVPGSAGLSTTSLSLSANGTLYVGGAGGLYRHGTAAGSWERLTARQGWSDETSYLRELHLLADFDLIPPEPGMFYGSVRRWTRLDDTALSQFFSDHQTAFIRNMASVVSASLSGDADRGFIFPDLLPLSADAGGRVWFGSLARGAVSFDPTSGHWTRFDRGKGLLSNFVVGTAADAEGGVWFNHVFGLSHMDATGRMTRIVFPVIPKLELILRIEAGPRDTLWMLNSTEVAIFHLPTKNLDQVQSPSPMEVEDHGIAATDKNGWLWVAEQIPEKLELKLRAYDPTTAIPKDVVREAPSRSGRIHSIASGPDGAIWVASAGKLSRYEPAAGSWNDFSIPEAFGGEDPRAGPIMVDRNISFWRCDGSALLRLASVDDPRVSVIDGVACGFERGPFWGRLLSDAQDALWSLAPYSYSRDREKSHVIRYHPATGSTSDLHTSRRAALSPEGHLLMAQEEGILVVGDDSASWIERSQDIPPVSILEPIAGGAVWVGEVLGGVHFYHGYEKETRLDVGENGLPGADVISISQAPDTSEARVWIATSGGIALAHSTDGVLARGLEGSDLPPGPPDGLLALPQDSALAVYNRVDPNLVMDPNNRELRRQTFLLPVSVAPPTKDAGDQGGPRALLTGGRIDLAGTHVWSEARGRDDEIWLGTTDGLYRLSRNGSEWGKPEKITADQRLATLPISRLAVASDGMVWCGIDGWSDDSASSQILGFNPGSENVEVFGTDRGLPRAERIDFLGITRDDEIVVMAGDDLVRGRLSVRGWFRWDRHGVGIAAALLLSAALGGGIHRYQRQRDRRARFRPVMETARKFFETVEAAPQRVDFRTLKVAEPALKSPVFVPARCSAESHVPVEEVLELHQALRQPAGDVVTRGYLVHPQELARTAQMQINEYLLKERAAIIPLPVPFMESARGRGASAAMAELEDLRRSYLGEQDRFERRNAISLPWEFYGRRGLLEDITRSVLSGEHTALVGLRKMGKTSVLNMLAQRLIEFPTAHVDLQSHRRDEPDWPQRLLVKILTLYDTWGRSRYETEWAPQTVPLEVLDGSRFEDAFRNRAGLQRRLGNPHPLVLMLDEMERVYPATETPAPEHVERYLRAVSTLRALGQDGGRILSLVVADLRPLFNRQNRFQIPGVDTNPFYRLFQESPLPPLEAAECREMLLDIAGAMGLEFESDLSERIIADSGGHPTLVRQLASVSCRHRGGAARIRPDHYETGMEWLRRERGEPDTLFRESVWLMATPEERRILTLATLEEGVPESRLVAPGLAPGMTSDGSHGFEGPSLTRQDLETAHKDLLILGLLETAPDGYRIRGRLLREWIARNASLDRS